MPVFESIVGTVSTIGAGETWGLPTTVDFRKGDRAILPSGPDYDVHRRRLALLQSVNFPAYVQVERREAGAPLIRGVDIPSVGYVQSITPVEGGEVVSLDRAAARFLLRADAPRADEMKALLRQSLIDRQLLVVWDESTSHEILDVTVAEDLVVQNNPPLLERTDPSLRREDVLAGLTPMPESEATAFVQELDTTGSCGLPGSSADCIPFMYPDDGCFARAHRMCEILEQRGIVSGKVWIYSERMSAVTAFHPSCTIGWTWHVATIVRSQEHGSALVVDPTLFDEAADLDTFILRLNDPIAQVDLTDMTPFFRERDGRFTPERPAGSLGIDATESYLRIYREQLARRVPPPPFRCGRA